MHFRYRKNIVQVVRTTYDPATKKPRSEIVGRFSRSDEKPAPEALAECTPAEVEEVHRWIAGNMKANSVGIEHAARSLSGQIAKAAEWFETTDDMDSARLLAMEVLQPWARLRSQFRRRGLLD
jgi:hypothetical protein